MQILSENLELAEYEYRATLNNKTFGGPTATTATTQHMKTLLSSQWMPSRTTIVATENLRYINEEEHSFIQVLEWWFMLGSALVWWCWGWYGRVMPGDGDVMTSVEISNVCQIQFYLHPTSTATHSAAHFPMEGSCCYLFSVTVQLSTLSWNIRKKSK